MDSKLIEGKFARMGARAKVRAVAPRNRRQLMRGRIQIDVDRDRHGEYFDVMLDPDRAPDLSVLDVRPRERHLLLAAADSKFLCGFDERHWFVAAIPETSGAANVATAKEALKPTDVRRAESRVRLKRRERNRRRNRAFIRQGEWFFLPEPDVPVNDLFALRNEPLVRSGGGKPHIAEYCIRSGGETVYVDQSGTRVLTANEYEHWRRRRRNSKLRFTAMRRNPGVYVRGKVRHPDHKTIVLDGWHRVVMNTENQSLAKRHVTFLD